MFNPDCRVFINSENSSNSFSARFGVSLSGRIGQTRALLSPGRCKRFVKDENGRFPTITCFGIESLGRFRSTQKRLKTARGRRVGRMPSLPVYENAETGRRTLDGKEKAKKVGETWENCKG